MQKRPLSFKAMIAALSAAIPAAPLVANAVPSPKAPPSVFASAAAAVKAGSYSKGHFLLKDAARIGPPGAAAATEKATKSTKGPKSTKKMSYARPLTAVTDVRKS